jgi:hypothetical protein
MRYEGRDTEQAIRAWDREKESCKTRMCWMTMPRTISMTSISHTRDEKLVGSEFGVIRKEIL